MNIHNQLKDKAISLAKEHNVPIWVVMLILSEGVSKANTHVSDIHTVKPAKKTNFNSNEF